MGLFDSVAGTFFNTATSVYNAVVRPVVSTATQVVQTVTKPVVQGSYPTGATQQVAVQPKPPIVTSVANQNTLPAQQALAQASGSPVITTQQVTPQGQTVYVSSRASPIQPEPVIISRPVQVQAPSIVDVTGALIPGAGLALAARTISGDPQVIQNAAMDITGLRQVAIQNQQASLQARNDALIARNNTLTQTSLNQRAALEQRVLGFEQKKQRLQERITEFESRGPATSIEEYNTRLNEYNLLTSDISALNLEGERINADAVAANRNLVREQIGILNTRDQLQAEGVALNVQAANIGTTGLAGLTTGFDLRVNKPISDALLTGIGKPFGMSKEDVALGLQLNRQVSEGMVTFGGPSIQNIGAAYGAGMVQDTLMKPGEALFWTGVGIATGGATRALGPGIEGLAAAARVPGASVATRALGAGVRIAPIAMGGLFAGSVGLDVASQGTPGKMVSRLGGLTATEILPMIGGGIVGYRAPEILSGAAKTMRGFGGSVGARIKHSELGSISRDLGDIPALGPQNKAYQGWSVGKPKPVTAKRLARTRAIQIESEPRLFDVEARIQGDWSQGAFDPFTTTVGKGKPRVVRPGGTAQLSVAQRLGIQESVYRGKPTTYKPRQRGRFPGVEEYVNEPGFWERDPFPRERFLDLQAKQIRRGQPVGVGGRTATPTPPEWPVAGTNLKVNERIATNALAKYNVMEPESGAASQLSKWNKPIDPISRAAKVSVSPETKVRIQKSRDIAQVYQQGYRAVKLDAAVGLEFEPLGTGTQRALLPGGMKFSKPAPSPGGSKTLAKTFKNAENSLNPIPTRGSNKGGTPELKQVAKDLDVGSVKSSYETPQIAVPYQDITGVKGVATGRAPLPNAAGFIRGRRGLRFVESEESQIAGPLALRTFGIPQLTNRESDDYRVGLVPIVGSLGVSAAIMRSQGAGSVNLPSIDKLVGINLDSGIRPEITRISGIGQLPTSLVGTIIEPRVGVTPFVSTRTDIMQVPDIALIPATTIIPAITQTPDITTTLVPGEILITTPEIPVYSPPEYIFEIPPIPPPIIPGFPVAGGGGGGGGGFGGQGGFLFEESWLAGGNEDPFGVGKMNFDVGTLSGISTGTKGRKRRRR